MKGPYLILKWNNAYHNQEEIAGYLQQGKLVPVFDV